MSEIMVRRNGNILTPVDDLAAEGFANIPASRDVLITVRAPRNPRHHRLAWALAQKVADACDWLHDRDDAMDFLKLKARHYKAIVDPRTGQTAMVPKSIAFGSLDQVAFNRLFNRMVWVICNDILPGLDEAALRAEIEAMCADNRQTRRAA